MDEKLKILIDIIMEAYNNTEHAVTNPYYYSLTVVYNSNAIDAGIDINMENYIKEHTALDIYEQYNWHKSDGSRFYISLK